jgi:hypothetical protein
MKRRTLDFILSGGGAAIAVLLLVLGFVLSDQASFAKSYVADQLGQQKITFATADKLSEEDTTWKPGSSCLIEYAGELMTKGKQAECYANYYIALHMDQSATRAGYSGETYATMGGIRSGISAELTAAKENGADEDTLAEIQGRLDAATSLRSTFQTGETLRGLLLTSYGFSIFGEKAQLAADVAYAAAALLGVLSVAGFVHAFTAEKNNGSA